LTKRQQLRILAESAEIHRVKIFKTRTEGIMGTVQYRVEPNHLTKPASYKLRFIPQQTTGYDELAAAVIANGEYTHTLPGFAGSAVSSLEITVHEYAALRTMIRNDYDSRLVDILDVVM